MKKILSAILILLTRTVLAQAGAISGTQAASIAALFFGTAGVEHVWNDGSDEPAFYAFNKSGGGWVIVSGDDSAYPIVAYSPEGSFSASDMPAAVRSWFDGYGRGIRTARSKRLQAGTRTRAAWAGIGQSTKAAGESELIETAEWGQDEPYNYSCPYVKEGILSRRSLCGCLPLAIAIVLRHNGYPEKGSGVLPGYEYYPDKSTEAMSIPSLDISGHRYRFNDMPLKDKDVKRAGAAVKQTISDFIYDIAVAVQVEFNYSSGSGATSDKVVPALSEHFGYSASAAEIYRMEKGANEWISILKGEINAGRPVIYTAQSDDKGGHAFVIGGYDEKDMFHVNWGWNGKFNGYYCINNFEGLEIAFDRSHSAIIGLEPDPEGTSPHEDHLTLVTKPGEGISVSSGQAVPGNDFTIDACWFFCLDAYGYEGYVKAALIDGDDNLKEYIGDETPVSCRSETGTFYPARLTSYGCRITAEPVFGDAIGFFFKTGDEWKPVSYDHEGGGVSRYQIYDACAIRVPDNLKIGDAVAFELMMGQKSVSNVTWYYDNTRVTSGQVVLSSGVHTLKAEISFYDGTTETVVREIVP